MLQQQKEEISIALQIYKSLCFEFMANQSNSSCLKEQENKILAIIAKVYEEGKKEEKEKIMDNIHSIDYPIKSKSLFSGAYRYYMQGCNDTRKDIIKIII